MVQFKLILYAYHTYHLHKRHNMYEYALILIPEYFRNAFNYNTCMSVIKLCTFCSE